MANREKNRNYFRFGMQYLDKKSKNENLDDDYQDRSRQKKRRKRNERFED